MIEDEEELQRLLASASVVDPKQDRGRFKCRPGYVHVGPCGKTDDPEECACGCRADDWFCSDDGVFIDEIEAHAVRADAAYWNHTMDGERPDRYDALQDFEEK